MMWKLLIDDVAARTLPVRKWLSYFTLFVAGGAVAGDLITLVDAFLRGEITFVIVNTRFHFQRLLPYTHSHQDMQTRRI